jgi:hypothetical protein
MRRPVNACIETLGHFERMIMKSFTNWMFPDTCWYQHFFPSWYVELVPKVRQHLSVTLCMSGTADKLANHCHHNASHNFVVSNIKPCDVYSGHARLETMPKEVMTFTEIFVHFLKTTVGKNFKMLSSLVSPLLNKSQSFTSSKPTAGTTIISHNIDTIIIESSYLRWAFITCNLDLTAFTHFFIRDTDIRNNPLICIFET